MSELTQWRRCTSRSTWLAWSRILRRPTGSQRVGSPQDRVRRIVDVAVVLAVSGFVLGQLGLGNLLLNTTPTGGDMGAHVWGPAFLRDHVLPHGQLTGWTPDWYDGFPAYEFYMVLPALLIVALNAGLHGWAALLPAAGALVVGFLAWRAPARSLRRHVLAAAAVVGAVFLIGLPYDVAFKIVTVLGVMSLPVAAYAFGRLAGLPFPTPAMFTIATLPFLFNREPTLTGTGNIIGGNLTSTFAGEFSFSLSLTFGLLFLGTIVAGFRTGRYRWLAAILLALTALCHVIVAIFVLIAAALAFLVWPGKARLVWLACVLPVGGLLTAFWTLPFFARSAYVNDMGWEKLPGGAGRRSALHLLGQFITNTGSYGTTNDGYRTAVLKSYLVPDLVAVVDRPRGRRPRRRRRSPHSRRLVARPRRVRHGCRLHRRSRVTAVERAPAALLLPRALPARRSRHRRAGARGRGACFT